MVDTSPRTSGNVPRHGVPGHRSTNTPGPPDVPFLNELCIEDCPARVKWDVALNTTHPVAVSSSTSTFNRRYSCEKELQ
ncbi:hypothetical protein HPB52_009497 [Rhipicephalus sanguineus]|uniref:Uncharacterized protein n=1 Tax=Rhipicephalus sanguineus TaxID=34632 RepID=A0A9D4QD55_RHISA|nr:hypothetical protein HPB52_009497 [Rhipicephalus sanguineus]